MSKQYHHLWPEITSFANRRCSLPPLLAYKKAARGKRSKPAAAAFEYRLENNLVELQDELRQGLDGAGVHPFTMVK